MKDSLGDRMKVYENVNRNKIIRRMNSVIRIDGKSFSHYTKGLDRPFDKGLMDDMDETTKYICKNIQGAKFGYVQSDEISILLTDYDDVKTDMWFDGNIQKMVSVAASMATSKFNQLRLIRKSKEILRSLGDEGEKKGNLDYDHLVNFKMAEFDARVFQLPSPVEVHNYFLWRQQDATRNSISSVAQSLYSHRELEKKDSDMKQEMIFQKGINWNDYTSREKRGGFITKVEKLKPTNLNPYTKKSMVRAIGVTEQSFTTIRNSWESVECPIFTQDPNFIISKLPE